MIVYLDTSALVPLLVAEPGSARCRRLWDEADTVLCAELGYVEAAAALARAERMGRLVGGQREAAIAMLDELWTQLVALPVRMPEIRRAAALAAGFGLRGYDAVHCAVALAHAEDDVVTASGDPELLDAWRAAGLAVVDTAA